MFRALRIVQREPVTYLTTPGVSEDNQLYEIVFNISNISENESNFNELIFQMNVLVWSFVTDYANENRLAISSNNVVFPSDIFFKVNRYENTLTLYHVRGQSNTDYLIRIVERVAREIVNKDLQPDQITELVKEFVSGNVNC